MSPAELERIATIGQKILDSFVTDEVNFDEATVVLTSLLFTHLRHLDDRKASVVVHNITRELTSFTEERIGYVFVDESAVTLRPKGD